jgi:hypothetical protein
VPRRGVTEPPLSSGGRGRTPLPVTPRKERTLALGVDASAARNALDILIRAALPHWRSAAAAEAPRGAGGAASVEAGVRIGIGAAATKRRALHAGRSAMQMAALVLAAAFVVVALRYCRGAAWCGSRAIEVALLIVILANAAVRRGCCVPSWPVAALVAGRLVRSARGQTANSLAWSEAPAPSPAWAARNSHAAVGLANGVVTTTGGDTADVYATSAGGDTLAALASTDFTARNGHAIAAVPGSDTTFMVVGGNSGVNFNDARLTADGGATFVLVSSSVFTAGGRYNLGLVARIGTPTAWVAFGGRNSGGTRFNEVRESVDDGATWTTLRADGGLGSSCADPALWSKRYAFAYAYLPLRDRIVLAGGKSGYTTYADDVWASDDGGTCWVELVANGASASGTGYYGAALVAVRNSAGVEMLLLRAAPTALTRATSGSP